MPRAPAPMTSSDAYTSGAMRGMKQVNAGNDMGRGPNSTPAGALQKRVPHMVDGGDMGSTPNSTPQGGLQESTQARGQPMIGYPGEIPQVMDLGGIPHNPDPNCGGAAQLQKRTRNDGF